MEQEFIELVNNHCGIIEKVCNVYFYKDPNKEDYQQEILIRLWKAYPGYKKQSAFSTWMYRVVLNTAIDILRKQSIQPATREISDRELKIPSQSNKTTSDEKELLYRAINQLPDAEKSIILLYLEDYSYEEIAEITGISESNTGVKINRIKKQLTKVLNTNGKR